MKEINLYIKSLKLSNHFILTIPSSSTLPASLQSTEKPFKETCFANELSSFYASTKTVESTKVERKSRKEMDYGNGQPQWKFSKTSQTSI